VHDSLFGNRWDAYERLSVLARGVTPVSLWPLIIMGNLGAWSCLDSGLGLGANFCKLNHVVKPFLL
jgi:hypothetical protein